jgi:hypothetical protein
MRQLQHTLDHLATSVPDATTEARHATQLAGSKAGGYAQSPAWSSVGACEYDRMARASLCFKDEGRVIRRLAGGGRHHDGVFCVAVSDSSESRPASAAASSGSGVARSARPSAIAAERTSQPRIRSCLVKKRSTSSRSPGRMVSNVGTVAQTAQLTLIAASKTDGTAQPQPVSANSRPSRSPSTRLSCPAASRPSAEALEEGARDSQTGPVQRREDHGQDQGDRARLRRQHDHQAPDHPPEAVSRGRLPKLGGRPSQLVG